ncbi:MAG: hypothetical protein ACI9UR_000900 [Bacteroidia bacterium]|jgi:hypothetical protein
MIQRIQTVYLAITAMLLVLPVVFPGGLVLASIEADAGSYFLFAEKMILKGDSLETLAMPYGLIGAVMVGIFISIYSIMQYKNRKFQIKLVQLAILVQLVFGALIFFYADKMAEVAQNGEVAYSPVIGFVLVNVVLYFLALRGIKKDDALVRSADRLR